MNLVGTLEPPEIAKNDTGETAHDKDDGSCKVHGQVLIPGGSEMDINLFLKTFSWGLMWYKETFIKEGVMPDVWKEMVRFMAVFPIRHLHLIVRAHKPPVGCRML